MQNITVKQNWDMRADKYGYDAVGVIGTRGEIQKEQYRKTIEFLKKKIPKTKTVVDYGCGVGKLSNLFNHNKYQGIDISDKMVEIAREHHPDYSFSQIQELPKATIYFTANVLQHNPDNFIKNWRPPAKELYLYEIIGEGKDKPHLFHRSIADYEVLLGLKCKKSWNNGSHTLMHYEIGNNWKK